MSQKKGEKSQKSFKKNQKKFLHPPPPIFSLKGSVPLMTQNGLKHILNMFLKSVTKTSLDPLPPMQKMLHF